MNENLSRFLQWCQGFRSQLTAVRNSELIAGNDGPNPSGHFTVELEDGRMGTLSYWLDGSASWDLIDLQNDCVMERVDDVSPDQFDIAFTKFADWLSAAKVS